MDVIDEDQSNSGLRSDDSSSDDKTSGASSKPTTLTIRPPPLEILHHVTINKSIETPRSTIKSVLNVPIQTDLKLTKENLNKVEEQLKRAFTEFYQRLQLLRSYSFMNMLAFSKILKKYDKVMTNLLFLVLNHFIFCLLVAYSVHFWVFPYHFRLLRETLPSPT